LVLNNALNFKKVYSTDGYYDKAREYVQSPFRYPGGKFYALKFIVPFLNAYPHSEYREPFLGGGSVFFGKQKATTNWLNDLDNDLITTYKIIQDSKRYKDLIGLVTKEVASRERHAEIKEFVPQNELEIAYRTYYLNRTSYSGIINKPAWGYAIGASSPPPNWARMIEGAHGKLQNVTITSIDFTEVIKESANTKDLLYYLDPPYFLADQKRAYVKSFVLEDHLRLERELQNINGAFLLSYDDCEEIRKLYSWAHIYEKSWFYNTANSSGPRKVGKELLITNYKIEHKEQLELI
jgi:DNA adenine methylase